jgi:hypothetical protein
LYGLKNAGATFHYNELSKLEWDGLMLIETIRAEIEQEQMEKQRLKSLTQQSSVNIKRR